MGSASGRPHDRPNPVGVDRIGKHAAQLAARPLGDLAKDAVDRGLASAVIVSGRATGEPAALADLRVVADAVPSTPLYVGSGATADRIGELLGVATGVIAGTAAKRDGMLANPVDPDRVRAIVRATASASHRSGEGASGR